MTVDVVVVNYMRPANIPMIIAGIRNQSVKCRIFLVDSSADTQYSVERFSRRVDAYFPLPKNYGGYGRFAVLPFLEHEYTYFADDDMCPGRHAIKHFVEHAGHIRDFACLSHRGRLFPDDMSHYASKNVKPKEFLQTVDLCVRGYFTRTCNLHHVLRFKWALGEPGMVGDKPFTGDDFLLCCSQMLYGGLESYVVRSPTADELMNTHELDRSNAANRRDQHQPRRDALVRRLAEMGWVPARLR